MSLILCTSKYIEITHKLRKLIILYVFVLELKVDSLLGEPELLWDVQPHRNRQRPS